MTEDQWGSTVGVLMLVGLVLLVVFEWMAFGWLMG